MESDLQQHHLFHDHPQHQQRMNSGLMRYRSAPSSYFSSAMDREFCDQFFDRPSSPETERIFARFMNTENGADDAEKVSLSETDQKTQFPTTSTNNETGVLQQQQQSNLNNYSSASQSIYQTSAKPPLPNQSLPSGNEGSNYSTGMNRIPQMRTGSVSNSNLIRHSSSPAGLFASINTDSGTYELSFTFFHWFSSLCNNISLLSDFNC